MEDIMQGIKKKYKAGGLHPVPFMWNWETGEITQIDPSQLKEVYLSKTGKTSVFEGEFPEPLMLFCTSSRANFVPVECMESHPLLKMIKVDEDNKVGIYSFLYVFGRYKTTGKLYLHKEENKVILCSHHEEETDYQWEYVYLSKKVKLTVQFPKKYRRVYEHLCHYKTGKINKLGFSIIESPISYISHYEGYFDQYIDSTGVWLLYIQDNICKHKYKIDMELLDKEQFELVPYDRTYEENKTFYVFKNNVSKKEFLPEGEGFDNDILGDGDSIPLYTICSLINSTSNLGNQMIAATTIFVDEKCVAKPLYSYAVEHILKEKFSKKIDLYGLGSVGYTTYEECVKMAVKKSVEGYINNNKAKILEMCRNLKKIQQIVTVRDLYSYFESSKYDNLKIYRIQRLFCKEGIVEVLRKYIGDNEQIQCDYIYHYAIAELMGGKIKDSEFANELVDDSVKAGLYCSVAIDE